MLPYSQYIIRAQWMIAAPAHGASIRFTTSRKNAVCSTSNAPCEVR